MGQQPVEKLYYREFEHPHPIIRTMNIVIHFTALVREHFKSAFHLNWVHIAGNATYLADLLLKANGLKFQDDLLVTYAQNFQDIKQYIDSVNSELVSFSNLIIHHPPTGVYDMSWDRIVQRQLHDLQNPNERPNIFFEGGENMPVFAPIPGI
jgi:hypothetical protein